MGSSMGWRSRAPRVGWQSAGVMRAMAPKSTNKQTDLWGPERLRKPEVQKEILEAVLKHHPKLTREEALAYLKEAGL